MRVLFAAAAAALIVVSATAQTPSSIRFEPVQQEPVIRHSDDRQAWDGTFTDPGAVLYHDGRFHLFRNGFRSWPGVVAIEHLVSEDGESWTAAPAGPIITSSDVPYSEVAALASGVLVDDDGTWVLYFYTWEAFSGIASGRIGRATAPDPEGPWAIDPQPVLNPGPQGSWDETRVIAPRVFRTDEGYVMYYTGVNLQRTGWMSIGRATSEDGIAWTKHDNPATTQAPFSESDPVFSAAEDDLQVHQASVFPTETGFVMFYRMFPVGGGDSRMTIHGAISTDGIAWDSLQDDPLWDRDTIGAGTSGFWWTAAAVKNGTYYLFVEEGSMAGTQIYMGTLRLN